MTCIYGDQPVRIKMTPNGVVHAGAYNKFGGYKRFVPDPITGIKNKTIWIPERKELKRACRRYGEDINLEKYVVDNTTPITCKQCLKAMGMLEEPITKRYVVFDTESGEFFKSKHGCKNWSKDINDAYLFKSKSAAENKCRTIFYEVDGNMLKYSKWVKMGKPKATCSKRMIDPIYEIKTVKITIID